MLSIIHTCMKQDQSYSRQVFLSQRRQFWFWIVKKNIALKISYKIVALFTENYPSGGREGGREGTFLNSKFTYCLIIGNRFNVVQFDLFNCFQFFQKTWNQWEKELPLKLLSFEHPEKRQHGIKNTTLYGLAESISKGGHFRGRFTDVLLMVFWGPFLRPVF